jgi:hypothetical protein
MFAFLTKLLLIARSRLKSQANLEAENLVLRQQVIALGRKSRSRVRLRNIDRLIFVWLYRFFPSILNAITVVQPETVIRWHRSGQGMPVKVVVEPNLSNNVTDTFSPEPLASAYDAHRCAHLGFLSKGDTAAFTSGKRV